MQIVFPVSQLKLSFIVPGRYSLDDSGHGEPGIGFRLPNGSVLYEHALMEDHATTALPSPSRLEPNRLALVYYQVRKLIGLAKQDWNHSLPFAKLKTMENFRAFLMKKERIAHYKSCKLT